jgi:hypothetical protein
MRRPVQRAGRARIARTGILALSVAVLSAAGIAACGSVTPSVPASVTPSVPASVTPSVPATSQAPSLSGAPATSQTPSLSGAPAATATPHGSGAAGSFDACALLTTAEVAKILGHGTVQAKPMPSSGWVAGQCAWNGPTSGFFLSVGTAASIAAFGDPAAPTAEAMLAAFKSAPGDRKDVTGIGDGAAAGTSGIAAYKGGIYLEITNLGFTGDQLIEIAKLAVAKL